MPPLASSDVLFKPSRPVDAIVAALPDNVEPGAVRVGGSPDVRSCVPGGDHRVDDGDVQHIVASPAFGVAAGRSFGLDATTGARRWRYAPSTPRLASITVGGGRVWLVLENGEVLALDAASGKVAARFGDHKPARTTIQAARLPGGATLEIDVIVITQRAHALNGNVWTNLSSALLFPITYGPDRKAIETNLSCELPGKGVAVTLTALLALNVVNDAAGALLEEAADQGTFVSAQSPPGMSRPVPSMIACSPGAEANVIQAPSLPECIS